MDDLKRCSRCKENLPRSEFPPSKQKKDGLFPYCRPCKRRAVNESSERHRERRRAEARERYAADPEPAKARRKKRYYADPARAVAEATEWNRRNPEKHKASRKKWQQANLHGLVREATRRRYATRQGARSIYFTPDELTQRAAFFGRRCWICRVAPMTEWDHVIPLSRGGWHCLANLRPACRPCNARKGDAWPYHPTP